MSDSLLAQSIVCSIEDVIETIIHTLAVLVTRSQLMPPLVDTNMVDECVLVDPHMIYGVPLSLSMDVYRE